MKLYSENNEYKLYQGSMLDMLKVIEFNSIDSIVCDPPYELNFMGKSWDNAGVSFNSNTWKQCYEVLKPGGYLLSFGGSRTYHRIAVAIEEAGFEIRDTIMWLYGSGFPKSMNIGLAIDKKNGIDNRTGKVKSDGSATGSIVTTRTGNLKKEYEERIAQNEWQGWGTCLKPSFEPIIVARKPFKGSLVDNVIKNGVGGLNIDECRVDFVSVEDYKITANKNQHEKFGTLPMTNNNVYGDYSMIQPKNYSATGRFPANTILTYEETDFDEVCGGFPYTKNSKRNEKHNKDTEYTNTYTPSKAIYTENNTYDDSGSASRYFYCAKASKKDRDEGLDTFEKKVSCDRNEECYSANVPFNRSANPKRNTHPTVKPTTLMQYLVRLVTPKNGVILDPFNGSGSTGKAVMYENKERNKNYKYIGIELNEEYLPIAKARIEYVNNI